jgi:hypothetical protein
MIDREEFAWYSYGWAGRGKERNAQRFELVMGGRIG